MKKLSKSLVFAFLFIVILLVGIFVFVISTRHESNQWKSQVEDFYVENKETLSSFVEICFDNKINYIGDDEYFRERLDICYEINNYFVYTSTKLEDDVKNNLEDIFDLFKQYQVHDIDITEDSTVSIAMGKFSSSLSLKYTEEKKTIEQIFRRKF